MQSRGSAASTAAAAAAREQRPRIAVPDFSRDGRNAEFLIYKC